ncbi:MAG: hypothetical protein ACJ739_14035 [Acidimicrobiales bacterium]
MEPVPSSTTVRFAHAVQAIAGASRAQGLLVPSFRSPPRLVGVLRSIKRWEGGATIAVVVRGRPWPAVQADLIEGVVAANGLVPPDADRARSELWLALEAPVAEEDAAA